MKYLLVCRLKDNHVTAHTDVFDDVPSAARGVTRLVHSDLRTTGMQKPLAAAKEFGDELAALPVGKILPHKRGYAFRILEADFTRDGAPVVPGLVVQINRDWWGTVWPEQFMTTAHHYPGSQFFDRWYLICKKGESQPYAKYNGARMTAGAMGQ